MQSESFTNVQKYLISVSFLHYFHIRIVGMVENQRHRLPLPDGGRPQKGIYKQLVFIYLYDILNKMNEI